VFTIDAATQRKKTVEFLFTARVKAVTDAQEFGDGKRAEMEAAEQNAELYELVLKLIDAGYLREGNSVRSIAMKVVDAGIHSLSSEELGVYAGIVVQLLELLRPML
jgi:hypothetical protein